MSDQPSGTEGTPADRDLRARYEKKRLAEARAQKPAVEEPRTMTAAEQKEAAKAGEAQAEASEYERVDLMRAAHAFGTTPEVVSGMLRWAGKTRMTRAEAQAALDEFLAREV